MAVVALRMTAIVIVLIRTMGVLGGSFAHFDRAVSACHIFIWSRLRPPLDQHSLANQGDADKIPPHRFEPATFDAGTHRHRGGIRKLDGLIRQTAGIVRRKPTAEIGRASCRERV